MRIVPTRKLLAAIAVLLILSASGGRALAASFAIFDSDRGDPVGNGAHYQLTSPGGAFVGESFGFGGEIDGRVHALGAIVQFTDAVSTWVFSFTAPFSTFDLTPGSYVADGSQLGEPTLHVHHDQADCSNPSGTFTVHDIAFGSDGSLLLLDVEFVQRCQAGGPRLHGVVRFHVGDAGCVGQPDGTACNDTSSCTTEDTCRAGGCVSGSHVNCNDGNGATDDVCYIDSGCSHRTAASVWDLQGQVNVAATARGHTIHRTSSLAGTLTMRIDHTYENPTGTCPSTGVVLPAEVGKWRTDRRGRLHLRSSNIQRVLRAVQRCFGAPSIRVTSYRHWVEIRTSGGTFCRWTPVPADGRHLCGYLRLHLEVIVSGIVVEENEVVRYAAERIDRGGFLPQLSSPSVTNVTYGGNGALDINALLDGVKGLE